jgi:hypothetical protein
VTPSVTVACLTSKHHELPHPPLPFQKRPSYLIAISIHPKVHSIPQRPAVASLSFIQPAHRSLLPPPPSPPSSSIVAWPSHSLVLDAELPIRYFPRQQHRPKLQPYPVFPFSFIQTSGTGYDPPTLTLSAIELSFSHPISTTPSRLKSFQSHKQTRAYMSR